MTLDTEVQSLRQVPMFRDVEPARLKLLAFASERVRFEPGQRLFSQGDVADAAYVILEGSVDVLLKGTEGDMAITRLSRDALLGEMGILAEAPRSASIVAAEPTVALKIDKSVFLELLKQFPQMAMAVMRELAVRLESMNERLQQLQTPSGEKEPKLDG